MSSQGGRMGDGLDWEGCCERCGKPLPPEKPRPGRKRRFCEHKNEPGSGCAYDRWRAANTRTVRKHRARDETEEAKASKLAREFIASLRPRTEGEGG